MSFNAEISKRIRGVYPHIPKAEAESVVEMVFSGIREYVNVNKAAKIPNFGVFKLKQTKERMGRNPRTGESVPIPAKVKLAFKETK